MQNVLLALSLSHSSAHAVFSFFFGQCWFQVTVHKHLGHTGTINHFFVCSLFWSSIHKHLNQNVNICGHWLLMCHWSTTQCDSDLRSLNMCILLAVLFFYFYLFFVFFYCCITVHSSAICSAYITLRHFRIEKKRGKKGKKSHLHSAPSATFDMRIYAFVISSKALFPYPFKSTNTCDYEWCHQKAQLTYLLFQESWDISFFSVGKRFPCVVGEPDVWKPILLGRSVFSH